MASTKEFVITPVGRVYFPSVAEVNEKSGKYELKLIFDKDDDFKKMKKLHSGLFKQVFGDPKELSKAEKALYKNPFRDGDADKPGSDLFAGKVFVRFSSKFAPGIVNTSGKLLEAEELYSGCYARVKANCFSFDTNGNKGISFGLQSLLFVKDGDMIGGGQENALKAFGDYIEEDGGDDVDDTDNDDLFD